MPAAQELDLGVDDSQADQTPELLAASRTAAGSSSGSTLRPNRRRDGSDRRWLSPRQGNPQWRPAAARLLLACERAARGHAARLPRIAPPADTRRRDWVAAMPNSTRPVQHVRR